jgi:hypothetical protein
MKSLNVDKYVSKYMFGKDQKILPFIKFIEDHCGEIEKGILSNDNQIAIKLLYEYLYITDVVYKSVGLMRMVRTNPDLDQADTRIETLVDNFFKSEEIFTKVSKLKVHDKIIKKFTCKQNESIELIQKNIKHLEQQIQNLLNTNVIMKTTPVMKKQIAGLPDNLPLSRQTYYYLQRNLNSANERKQIEDLYYQKANSSLQLLSQLIIERHKYAILSGCSSYFHLIKKKLSGESENIKSDIDDLILKINQRSKKEIDRIFRSLKSDGFDKKVDVNDIVYYYEKFKTKVSFTPNHVLKILFNVINKYFNIDFIESKQDGLWSDNVKSYKVGIGKELFGYCYLDLLKSSGRSISSPNCIHLCHQYTNLNSKTIPTRIVIIGNYPSLDETCMSFSDVIYLFREFGYAIQSLSYKTSNGVILPNEEFDVLMPQIMECIAWEKSTIELLCVNELVTHPNIVDNVIFMRHTDFAHSIKLRCVNALFDHMLHNSPELIKILKTDNSNGKQGSTLLSIYKKTYKNIMFSQQDILNVDISGINPTLIQQQINGSESLLYCNIYSEILSFNIFQLVASGHGQEFISNVLRSDQTKMKKPLESFISKANNNSYELYLKELIGYSEIDTEVNNKINNSLNTHNALRIKKHPLPVIVESSANQFDEDTDVSNVENVIKIDRRSF